MYWSVAILDRYWAVFNLDKIVDEDVLDTLDQERREEWKARSKNESASLGEAQSKSILGRIGSAVI